MVIFDTIIVDTNIVAWRGGVRWGWGLNRIVIFVFQLKILNASVKNSILVIASH